MNPRAADLRTAVINSGLKNGARISFHHHLRLGDGVVEQVLAVLEKMEFRDLTISASSLMGHSCDAVLRAVRSGVVARIETTGLKEPLSSAVLRGELTEPVIFRTHGGRGRAVRTGETPIHTAFLAVSFADTQGNGTGTLGANRFGSLGYAQVDAAYADHVILITDELAEEPLLEADRSLRGDDRFQVVRLDSIGDRSLIGGGSLRRSGRPVEKVIAKKAFEAIQALEVITSGFSYQSGSGGISLLVTGHLEKYMRTQGIRGRFASGGITEPLVNLLKEGYFSKLYDVQSFDNAAVASLRENPDHIEMDACRYADPGYDYPGGCIAGQLDLMILSATEVDLDFNLNSITGTNGRILGALGGAPDTAEGSGITVAVLPSLRGRIPTINRRVNLICTPGRYVDLIVTDRGIAVNPLRPDLLGKLTAGGIDVCPVETLMNLVYALTGTPALPECRGRVLGIVEDRHGGVLDTIRKKGFESEEDPSEIQPSV